MAKLLEPDIAPAKVAESSDRSFGLVFAALFLIIACWPFLSLAKPHWWSFSVSAAFAILAVFFPSALRPLNRAWLAFGRLLHKVMSPLVLGTIFFGCVTPTAWIMRLRRKDLLTLRWRPDAESYWIPVGPKKSEAETMKDQF